MERKMIIIISCVIGFGILLVALVFTLTGVGINAWIERVFSHLNGIPAMNTSNSNTSNRSEVSGDTVVYPGLHSVTLTHNQMEREVHLYIPEVITSNLDESIPPQNQKRYPAIIIMHGYGGDGLSMVTTNQFMELADRDGIILVYPEGLDNSWNANICCGPAMEDNIDDTGFIASIPLALEESVMVQKNNTDIVRNVPLDRSRVYLTGFSNGGMMAFHTAAEYPELFAAIAPVAASIGGTKGLSPQQILPQNHSIPVPAIMFYGLQDQVVPFQGGDSPVGPISFTSANESSDFWARQNGCSSVTQEDFESTEGEMRIWECPQGADTVQFNLNAGHGWFITPEDVSILMGGGGSMEEVIWNFFRRF